MAAYSGVAGSKLAAVRFGEDKFHESPLWKSQRRIVSAKEVPASAFFRVNLVLVFLALASVLFYIFLSNFLVSQKYLLNLRRQQFNQLSAELSSESVGHSRINDLLSFVRASGMVEAVDAGTILEDSGVALSGNRY